MKSNKRNLRCLIEVEKIGSVYTVRLIIDGDLFSQVGSLLEYQIPRVVSLLLLESLK